MDCEEERSQKESDEGEILNEEDWAYVKECRKKYETICGKYPPNFGKALSRRERDTKELFSSNLVYSEISFDALALTIMKIVKKYGKNSNHGSLPSSGGKFYDLGSGIGKALIAAGLVYNFASCHGIEILEALHNGAEWVLESYYAKATEWKKSSDKLPTLHATEGDFLENVEWQGADLLFINGSCYGDEILNQLMKLSMKLKKGAFVISVSYAIPSKEFELYEYEEHAMNWGPANVFIQQKVTDSHEYVEPVEEEEEEDIESKEDFDDEVADLAKTTLDNLFG